MSQYTVFVTPSALREIRGLPGNVRQRVKRAIHGLADNPTPPHTKALDAPKVKPEVRRLRLGQWRIIYAVTEADEVVDVLAVRKRPPYDYGDLESLLSDLG